MRLTEAARLLAGTITGGDASFAAVGTDSRRLRPGDLFVALQGPLFDGHDFVAAARDQGACGVLVSQPVVVDLPQVKVTDTLAALGQLATFWRERVFRGTLIGLTGSNGKTTVKEMIAAILRCADKQVLATRGNLNNEIGLPLTLLGLQSKHTYAVVEMGANHPGEIAYLTSLARLDVALITNAGPAHLEGFGSLDGVARAKGEIFQGLPDQGTAIINRDDAYAAYWDQLAVGRRIVDFGLQSSARVHGRILDEVSNRFQLCLDGQCAEIKLALPGRHNLCNALAAAAAAYAIDIPLEQICRGLQSVGAIAGRLRCLSGPYGSTLIDDTYNANLGSLCAAFAVVGQHSGGKWLVLGDMAELGSEAQRLHEQAGLQARAAGFQRLFALGEHSRRTVLAFGAGAVHYPSVDDLITALSDAVAQSGVGPAVLIKGSRSMSMERVVQAMLSERASLIKPGAYS